MNNISTFTRIITILLYNISIRRKKRKKGKNDVQSRETERERFIRGKLRISKRQDKLVLPGIRVSSAITVQTWKVDKKVGVVFEIALTFETRVSRGGGRVLFKAFKRQEATKEEDS